MRLFAVSLCFALLSTAAVAQTSFVTRYLKAQQTAAPNCLKEGEGGNDQGLGGSGGCWNDSECCAGLKCIRVSNDFATCQTPWDGKPTPPPVNPPAPTPPPENGFCSSNIGSGGCWNDSDCCVGFSCQRVTNDFADCLKN